jgi:arginase
MKKEIRIIGVPMDLGQGRRGVDMGPYALRYAELEKRLEALGHQVLDGGNLPVPVPEEVFEDSPELPRLATVSKVNRALADFCAKTINENGFPIVLGGDHSIAAGTVAGVRASGKVGVLWIDAHADFNTPTTSPSKNLHGMPLGALVGQEPAALAPYLTNEKVHPREVVLIGLRSVDNEERQLLLDQAIKAFTMRDVDELGIAEVTRQTLNHFTRRGIERIHVSFDPDVLDPTIAPGVGTPVPGGLTYREAHLLMELLADDERVVSLDVVEINPILDAHNGTAGLTVDLIASLLGQKIL